MNHCFWQGPPLGKPRIFMQSDPSNMLNPFDTEVEYNKQSGKYEPIMNQQNYKPLTIGDIRQEGDEVRRLVRAQEGSGAHPQDYRQPPGWRPVTLIGHAILQSDLTITELRRPIK